jgi:CMP-N-acetylneuraminic acid synthetase
MVKTSTVASTVGQAVLGIIVRAGSFVVNKQLDLIQEDYLLQPHMQRYEISHQYY